MNNNTSYRADIDGLRAISIIAVLVYHIAPHRAPHGYLGVDVFFVISGFLITGIILKGLQRGDFSLADFFRRRIVRLFPALLAMLAATLPLAWMVLTPAEFRDFLDQLVAGALYVSNFYYYQQTGYFQPDAIRQPFLHLWTLAVEEQFYLVMPLLLLAAWRFTGMSRIGLLLALVATASLLSMLAVQGSSLAFFITWFRAWEFLAGGLLAWWLLHRRPPRPAQPWADAMAATGLLLIIAPMLTYHDQPHPGFITLLPVIGTVLVIAARHGIIARHLLGNRLMVFIGLISYPLYVWHYPLLSLSEYALARGLATREAKVAFVLLVFALATLTWLLLERRLRRQPRRHAMPLLASVTALALAAFAARTTQVPTMVTDEFLATASSAARDWRFPGFLKPLPGSVPNIHVNRRDKPVQVVFLGDSHAQQYAPRVMRLTRTHPRQVRGVAFATEAGCPPVEGLYFANGKNCRQRLDQIYNHLRAHSATITHVIITGAWNRYFFEPEVTEKRGARLICNTHTITAADTRYRQCFIDNLRTTMQRIRQLLPTASLHLVLDNPMDARMSPDFHLKRHNDSPRLLSWRLASILTPGSTRPVSFADIPSFPQSRRQIRLAEELRNALSGSADTIFDPAPRICPQRFCNPLFRGNGRIWFKYWDNNHLTATYARSFDLFDALILEDGQSQATGPAR